MKRIFGGPVDDMFRFLPTIVAELSVSIGFHQRGTRACLVLKGKDPLAGEEVECLAKTRVNRVSMITVRWDNLRFPDLQMVQTDIAKHCWRGTKPEMEQMVARIKAEKIKQVSSFAPDIEI